MSETTHTPSEINQRTVDGERSQRRPATAARCPEGRSMKFTRIAATAVGLAVALSVTACGSAEKTADKAADATAGAGSLIGVTMPTKSSERWIADGNNVKA